MVELSSTVATVEIRPMAPGEDAVVIDSWVRSFRKSAETIPLVAELAPDAYRAAQRVVALRAMRRSVVLVASFPSVPDEVCGYAVVEKRGCLLVLHWLYVKQAYRRAGIARQLLGATLSAVPHSVLEHSHETKAGREIARKLRSTFNPALAR